LAAFPCFLIKCFFFVINGGYSTEIYATNIALFLFLAQIFLCALKCFKKFFLEHPIFSAQAIFSARHHSKIQRLVWQTRQIFWQMLLFWGLSKKKTQKKTGRNLIKFFYLKFFAFRHSEKVVPIV
jgi:hypothetical protein